MTGCQLSVSGGVEGHLDLMHDRFVCQTFRHRYVLKRAAQRRGSPTMSGSRPEANVGKWRIFARTDAAEMCSHGAEH
jgi:hypothetical protein